MVTQQHYVTKSQFDRLELQVDLLDKELSLLKTQIQATLFTIQECILSGTYRALGDGIKPHARPSQQQREWRVKQFGPDQLRATPGVYYQEDDPELIVVPPFDPPIQVDDDYFASLNLEAGFPAVNDAQPDRKQQAASVRLAPAADGNAEFPSDPNTSLIEMLERLRANYPPADVRQPDPRTAEAHEPAREAKPMQLRDWLELDKWVSEKIKEMGVDGALELARLYSGRERETLIRLIAVYQERAPKPTAPVEPPAPPVQKQPAQPPQVNPILWNNSKDDCPEAKHANYRPFGEHQELVLELLQQVLRSREIVNPPPPRSNGTNGRH